MHEAVQSGQHCSECCARGHAHEGGPRERESIDWFVYLVHTYVCSDFGVSLGLRDPLLVSATVSVLYNKNNSKLINDGV